MARRKLTPEQENWLFLHFPNMTNKELAEKLTEMARKENQKQLTRLQHLLQEDFCLTTKKIISRKIDAINKFTVISEPLVKRYARKLHCPRKSREHLFICNQEKARATNIKRWLNKAEKVEHVMDWLRTLDINDIRYCIIDGDVSLKGFRVSINRFNRYEGYDRSIFVTSNYIPEAKLLRVNANLYRTTY
jgi:hypothetical protein